MTAAGSGRKSPGTDPDAALRSLISSMGEVAVAYSGGVDSTFLLHSCLKWLEPGRVTAVVVRHPLMREGEARLAGERAERMGAAVRGLDLDPRRIPEVAGNAASRCYHCKKFIFSSILELTGEQGIPWLLDGTNADDAEVYRPGIQALEELGVRSPLREAGFSKARIRERSRSEGLETWDEPSAPCLATRFPYNHPVSDRDLRRVEKGEALLRKEGFGDLRLRVHGDLARIEVPEPAIDLLTARERRQRLVAALRSLGYCYVTVDLEGLRSGRMDEGT